MASQPQKHNLTDPDGWVDRYADYLFGYALYRIPDRSTAEDLVQETFMAALSSRQSYAGDASEKTWLTGIMKHKIMDYLRRKYQISAWSLETKVAVTGDRCFDGQGGWLSKPRQWKENPQEHFEQQEFMEVLGLCLAGLSPRQAEAFRLRELDGADAKEICKVLHISSTNY